MGMFRYEAVDKAGKELRGVMSASDEQQVAQNLAKMGYSPQSIFAAGGKQSAAPVASVVMAPAASQAVTQPSVPVSVKSKVPAYKLAIFFRQLATLVKSGRPLNQSMTDVRVSDGRIREALPQIQNSLQAGQALSGAMASYPDIFPVHVISSVWSGELNGRLDIALDEIAQDFEQESSETRISRIGWGLTKLTLLSFVFIAPACNLEKLLMPVASQSVNSTAIDSRAALQILWQGYMHAALTQSLPICSVFIASWVIWGHMKRVPTLKRILDSMLLRVPVWGPLHRSRSLSRFLHILDGLTAAGINLPTAWDAASLTPRNSEIAEKLKLAKNAVNASSSISEMFAAAEVFEPDDIGMAAVGEKSGSIPEVLSNLSRIYDNNAASQLTKGRMWSISAITTFTLILTGYAVIIMASSYSDIIRKFINDAGN